MIKRMLAVVIATALAAGCGPRGEAPKTESAPEAPRVALVLKTLNSPFFIDMERGAQEAAKRLGVNLTVQAAEREVDVDKQMQIIENLIQTAFYQDKFGIAPACALYYVGWNDLRSAHFSRRDSGYARYHLPSQIDSASVTR